MKKILMVLCFVFTIIAVNNANSVRVESHECAWFWTSSFASTTSDPPDYVYCRMNGGSYTSVGTSYVQFAAGADDLSITWDTDVADGSTTIGSLLSGVTNTTIICSNVGATIDINFLASANNSQYSKGGVYYWQEQSLADEDSNTFTLTPVRSFKITATESAGNAACVVVYSTVTWVQR